jgi:hypothetical protein
MIWVAAVLSAILVAAAWCAARPQPHPVRWAVFGWTAALVVTLPMLLQAFATAAAVLAFFLGLALMVWPRVRHRVRSFAPFAGVAVVVTIGFACLAAWGTMSRYDRLREQYPYESMEERIPAPPPASGGAGWDDGTLATLESDLDRSGAGGRAGSLRQLHEERVRLFTNSPGFGVRRLAGPEWGLRYWPRDGQTDQPGPHSPPGAEPARDQTPSAADEPDLLTLHNKGTFDFVNLKGFGFVKDRRHVAGFISHGFSDVPSPTLRWHVERLDLIGVLLHPEPVAYVSDKLPAMDELRGAPTRKLDAFEVTGLDALRTGQTLYLSRAGDRPRMLGAVRNVRQCVGCHGGERGDLLGAFSYALGPGNR